MTESLVRVPKGLEPIFRVDAGTHAVRYRFQRGWHEVQNLIIFGKARYTAAACGTKVGKTWSCAARHGLRSFMCDRRFQGLFRVIAPTYQKTKPTFEYLNKMFPAQLSAKQFAGMTPKQAFQHREAWDGFRPDFFAHEMRMLWRHNQARIECMHGQDPEKTIEGDATRDNVLDEAAKMKPKVFGSTLSTTTQTGGPICEVGTPIGKNHFYARWRDAKDRMDFEMRKGIPKMECTHLALQLPSTVSPFLDQNVIADAQRKLPSRVFNGLYLAQFEDDGEVFANLEAIFKGAHEFEEIDEFLMLQIKGEDVNLGVDVAKKSDYTVYMAFDEYADHVGWKRYQGRQYKDQAADCYAYAERILARMENKRATVSITFDETGVGVAFGEAIRDIAQEKNNKRIYIRGVVWNNSNKEDAITDLMILCESEAWSMLPWERARHEFSVFEVSTTDNGNPTFSAPSGDHDDVVMACATVAHRLKNRRRKLVMETASDDWQLRLLEYERTGQLDELEDFD